MAETQNLSGWVQYGTTKEKLIFNSINRDWKVHDTVHADQGWKMYLLKVILDY